MAPGMGSGEKGMMVRGVLWIEKRQIKIIFHSFGDVGCRRSFSKESVGSPFYRSQSQMKNSLEKELRGGMARGVDIGLGEEGSPDGHLPDPKLPPETYK